MIAFNQFIPVNGFYQRLKKLIYFDSIQEIL